MQEGIDFVRCRVCGLESGVLSKHIGVHGLTVEEYRVKYPDAKMVADVVRDARSDKLRSKPHKEPTLTCRYCGGRFNGRVQRRAHERLEEKVLLNGEEGKDFVVCRECGFRSSRLILHIESQHGMTIESYRTKHPDAPVVIESIVAKQSAGKRALGGYKPIEERAGATSCDKCGETYLRRNSAEHLRDCVAKYPDKWVEGKDHVKCPECHIALSRLGGHLKEAHSWSQDKVELEQNAGLQLMAQDLVDQWVGSTDTDGIRQKREATMMERYGVKNPFSDPVVQAKIKETNQRRYGVDHPMQNEEVLIRQNESAQNGPSGQEVFFTEHVTCPNVVYTGYGGRFIRTKTGVRKYGRVIKDLNPDFMVLPDNVLESAISASKERRPLDRLKHRTKYVIELLGDWYHSEEVIGVKPEKHEAEVIAAYKSAGIECLVLWEHDVMERWNVVELMVDAWIQKAVADINASPVWKKRTRNKVDRRLATFVCPHGSGRKFKTQEQLDAWMVDPLNFWRPGTADGKDYVRCLECQNVRVGKVMEHLRKRHGGMTREGYLERHPGAMLVAERVSEMVAGRNRSGLS